MGPERTLIRYASDARGRPRRYFHRFSFQWKAEKRLGSIGRF